MDEHGRPMSNARDEGELLAAYLDAEIDEITAARLTRRLRDEPQLAARLDAIARTRMRLQRLDGVTPPAQFRDRLAARLAAERTEVESPQARAQAQAPRRRLAPLVAAAAIVLVAVLGATGVLRFLGAAGSAASGGGESADIPAAAPEAANRDDSAAAAAGDQTGQDSAGGTGEGSAAEGEALAAAPVPNVTNDADISSRIRDVLREPRVDPAQRERELREAAGLSTDTSCAAEVQASAVDLVRQNGDLLITALAADRQPPQIVVLDARNCTQIRVVGSGP